MKPLEIEQSMKKVENSKCTDAGLELKDLSLPESTGWEDPTIGDKSTVTGPPAIVAGVSNSSLVLTK